MGASVLPASVPKPQREVSKYEAPVTRPLKAYAFDPSRGHVLGNEMSLEVRYQRLAPGPVVLEGGYDAIAVMDYDGQNKVWYQPVDLDDPGILIRRGLDPLESDPRFHQQMVYAVVTETVQHFETALGRRINWRRQDRPAEPTKGWLPGDIRILNLYPHAMLSPNAFYSPRAHGILFGYFKADADHPGEHNLPGQTVYTCLSHDIIVHETTHAVVDGIRRFFTEQTNLDVPAFHEGLADIVALFRHFSHKEVLLDTIQRTGGALYKYQLQPDAAISPDDWYESAPGPSGAGQQMTGQEPIIAAQSRQRNPLVELAQQFGEATGRNRGLRSALGTKPNSSDIRKLTEPHARGSILVAAIFDAFFSIYTRSTADLFRIYRAGGGRMDGGDLPDALANRLAGEAARIAEQFFQVCVRALDYCAPVDITYGDYLRAIITAERDLRPIDEMGVREAFMQAFRLRGIVPESASFFSEGAIAWPKPDEPLNLVQNLNFGDPNGLTYEQNNQNGDALRAYANDPDNKARLGFDPNPSLKVTVPSFHPMFRINPDGSLRTDMVVELVQTQETPFVTGQDPLGSFPFRGGATLIISKPLAEEVSNDESNKAFPPAAIRYVIPKHLSDLRKERQRHNLQRLGLVEGSDPDRFQINFALVHGGL
jgi:hypothetical protein